MLRGCFANSNKNMTRILFVSNKSFSTNKVAACAAQELQDATPRKFIGSAGHVRNPHAPASTIAVDKTPKYQFPIVTISMLSFMIYFFCLREENDVDIVLSTGSLFDKIEGLEKVQLETCIMYYEERGMDTSALKTRLAELEAEQEEKDEQTRLQELENEQ